MPDDPYLVLGVSREATDSEIRAAYEKAITHAARSGHVQTAVHIDAAFEVLRNSHRRRQFDLHGVVNAVPRLHPDDRFVSTRSVPWRTWSPTEGTAAGVRPRRSRRASCWGAALVFLVLSTLAGLLQAGQLGSAAARPIGGDAWGGTPLGSSVAPPARVVSHPRRLIRAVNPPPGSGGFTVMSPSGAAGQPRFDPCQSIHYVISGNEPFAGADTMLTSAVRWVSAASGLRFTYVGRTSEPATSDRPAYQPDRYGKRWAPVLVAWTSASSVPGLAGQVVGLGGGSTASIHGVDRLVSGIVYLDAPDLAAIASRTGGASVVETTMIHEFGHLVGLDHVTDPASVMYPMDHPFVGLSAGDRRGFAFAGAASCPHVV